ncbi:Luteinizing hormone beta subunit isoform 2 [Scophthalmus maximus]|nr:Luteinizing hormone beta subunit isoform 2 [Scophthalmus maximus]
MTLSLEKEGCPRCHMVETTICSGHCRTKEPSIIFPHLKVYQHVCTYRELHYRTVQLPDCPAGVDPSVSYPEALSCHCNLCVTNMADCIRHEHREPDVCDNDLTFHV